MTQSPLTPEGHDKQPGGECLCPNNTAKSESVSVFLTLLILQHVSPDQRRVEQKYQPVQLGNKNSGMQGSLRSLTGIV